MQFDPKVQVRQNGPLTDDFKKRALAAREKHGWNNRRLAEGAGLAGSTLGNVLRYAAENISTASATRLAEVVEKLEAAPVESPLGSAPTPPRDAIADAIATLQKHGLTVILVAGTVPVAAVAPAAGP